MNKIAENQIANYFLDKKIEARTILSNSFNMICEKILLKNILNLQEAKTYTRAN